jgi:hypothetical protein
VQHRVPGEDRVAAELGLERRASFGLRGGAPGERARRERENERSAERERGGARNAA